MIRNIVCFLLICFFVSPGFCGPCDEYKKDVNVNIKKSEYNITVTPSDKDLFPVGGYVDVSPYNEVKPEVGYVFNGKYFCVFLKSVDIVVGFKSFPIVIDKAYKKDSCEYNAILKHENQHITDALYVFDTMYDRLKKNINDIVDSVEPLYVDNADSVPKAVDDITNRLVKNKKLRDLSREFHIENNKYVTALDSKPNYEFDKCIQDRITAAFKKYNEQKNAKKLGENKKNAGK